MLLYARNLPSKTLRPLRVGFSTLLQPKEKESVSVEANQANEPPPQAPSNLQPPREPEEGECCGNDCVNCVWTDYWEKLQEYERTILNQPPSHL